MSDLITWLTGVLDEIERVALAASPGPWKANAEHDEVLAVDDERVADGFALAGHQLRATVDHIVLNDPAAVLADVNAKRAMLAVFTEMLGGDPWQEGDYAMKLLSIMAEGYTTWPGYQEAWRP